MDSTEGGEWKCQLLIRVSDSQQQVPEQTQIAVGYVVTRFLEKMPKYSCNWQFGYKNFKISGNHIAHHSVVTPKKQILG